MRNGSYRDGRSYGRQNYNRRRRSYGYYPEDLIDEMKEQSDWILLNGLTFISL